MANSATVRLSLILRFVRENYFEDSDEEESFGEVTPKIVGFAEDVVPYMSDQQFKMNFRMSPTTFEALLQLIFSTTKPTVSGRPQIEIEKQILVTVWFLANLECIRSIASRFGLSKSTCWASINRGCRLLLEVNKKFRIICWPTRQQAQDISLCIEQLYHLPDVYAGQPGSVHDNSVYEKSDIFERVNNNEVDFPNNCHILGDLAYKLSNNLLVGFKNNGHLTRRQKNYNYILSRSRILIEHTFGLLKGRFRRLKLLETRRMDLIPVIIVSACILHNVCILNSDSLEGLNLEEEIVQLRQDDVGEFFDGRQEENVARQKRNDIMANLPLILADNEF